MTEPAPVPADQEEALAKAWAYLSPHPLTNGPVHLHPQKMRDAIATLRAAFEVERYETAEWAHATELQVWENATLRSDLAAATIQISHLAQAKGEAEAKVDQLASELREAREALTGDHAVEVACRAYGTVWDTFPDLDATTAAECRRQAMTAAIRALSDPRPSPAKGDDHGA